MSETLLYELTEGVAVLTLNRPAVMNALSAELRRSLGAALSRASAEAGVIVLTGAGRGFCSGQDLTDVDLATVDLQAILRDEYEPLLTAIVDCPVPVIAAVNGAAVGAGAGLALACDVVIASEAAHSRNASRGSGWCRMLAAPIGCRVRSGWRGPWGRCCLATGSARVKRRSGG